MATQWLPLLSTLFMMLFTNHVTAAPCANTQCNGAGWQYAVFNWTGGSETYDPTFMKSTTVGGQGTKPMIYYDVTTRLGGINDPGSGDYSINIYSNPTPVPVHDFVVSHRSYIYAATAGIYTFAFSAVDDNVVLWTGDIAKQGWNVSNANLDISWGHSANGTVQGPGSGSFSVSLTQGQYLPVRIIFAQFGWGAVFTASIIAPCGQTIFNSTYFDPTYFMTAPCGSNATPLFPFNWGMET